MFEARGAGEAGADGISNRDCDLECFFFTDRENNAHLLLTYKVLLRVAQRTRTTTHAGSSRL